MKTHDASRICTFCSSPITEVDPVVHPPEGGVPRSLPYVCRDCALTPACRLCGAVENDLPNHVRSTHSLDPIRWHHRVKIIAPKGKLWRGHCLVDGREMYINGATIKLDVKEANEVTLSFRADVEFEGEMAEEDLKLEVAGSVSGRKEPHLIVDTDTLSPALWLAERAQQRTTPKAQMECKPAEQTFETDITYVEIDRSHLNRTWHLTPEQGCDCDTGFKEREPSGHCPVHGSA